MNDTGFVYALINPSMEGLVKVGCTTRNPKESADELSKATGGTPFIVAYDLAINDCSRAEAFVHTYLEGKGYRVSNNREFFNVPLNVAIDAILEYKNEINGLEESIDLSGSHGETDCKEELVVAGSEQQKDNDINSKKEDAFAKSEGGRKKRIIQLESKWINTGTQVVPPSNMSIDEQRKIESQGNLISRLKDRIGCLGISVIIILLLIGGCSVNESYKSAIELNNTRERIENTYQRGITLIKEHTYNAAAGVFLSAEQRNYKNGKVLYAYALAEGKKLSDPSMAEYYLKEIPQTYNGEFASEIKVLREGIKEGAEKQREANREIEKEQRKERESKVYVGDGEGKVLQVMGEPQKKNRTVIGNTVREQWVYGNGKYIYIQDGSVTAWQD